MNRYDKIADEIISGDANMAYQQRMRDIRQSLRVFDKQLERHEQRQRKNPNDYGYVGDLEHISEELVNLMRFVGI